MENAQGEPVEISLRMRSGEWTRESLAELIASYKLKMAGMGAPDAEVVTEVDEAADGSVRVRVSWKHEGVHTVGDMVQAVRERSDEGPDSGGNTPPDEDPAARDAGKSLGRPHVSDIDAPPTERANEAQKHQNIPDAVVYTDSEGETYVEDIHGGRVRGKRHLGS